MRTINSLKVWALVALSLAPMNPAVAEAERVAQGAGSIIQDTGVANRLVAGELLRAHTQEIPAAACHLNQQINVADATENLTYGMAEIDALLTALLQGDIFWGITTPETRRKTIAEIEGLRAAWEPVQDAAKRLLADPSDADAAAYVIGMADPLMDQTARLVATLDGQYSGSAEILRRDVMFIQISGRMAALNQDMALTTCMLTAGGGDAELGAALAQSATLYHNSLDALRNGMDAMGILPPQTPGIAAKLDEIAAQWRDNRTVIAQVSQGSILRADESHDLYFNLIDERVLVLDLLYLYQDHSKVH